ncbi:hypothetical protein [Muribaculum intestinale]|nr:hypothetical protein [Muribaculum intestinale]
MKRHIINTLELPTYPSDQSLVKHSHYNDTNTLTRLHSLLRHHTPQKQP